MIGPFSLAFLALLSPSAWANRPTDGNGTYAFDSTDVVEYLDGPAGLVRVHYSVKGPNVVRSADNDATYGGDGIPDFAQKVAATAEDVLELFQETGLRLPLGEEEMGLDPLGGSYALDFYLVDFNYTGDGQFVTDKCSGGVCSGYMAMENDFSGYGYSSIDTAIRVLTSHELFHGVQFAYLDDLPGWMSEGTAMWSEYHYDADSQDFLAWCGRYLQEPDRGLDRTPAGAFTGWEYGTGLFFGFLDLYGGSDVIVSLFDQLADLGGDGALDALDAALTDQGLALDDVWTTFGSWNLATGNRAGAMDSYPFAAELDQVPTNNDGAELFDDERVYPLATVYFYVQHAGGELWFGTADDPTGLALRVHSATDLDQDAPVLDDIGTWWPDAPGAILLGDLDAGGYWVTASQPSYGGNSIAFDYCLGPESALEPCGLLGGSDTGGDTGADSGGDTGNQPKGCGCSGLGASGGAVGWLGLFPGLFLLWVRRR